MKRRGFRTRASGVVQGVSGLASLAAVLLMAASIAAQLPNPIVYFPFDTDGSDLSGSGNNGDLLGGAVITPGGFGKTGAANDAALDLGTFNNGAYVNLPTAASGALDSLGTNDAVTLSLWILGGPEQPQNQWTFRAQGPTTDRALGSHAPWGDGTVYFDVAGCCDAATQRISAPAPAESWSGQWNHYAYVKDGPQTAIYINGNLHVDSGANSMLPLPEITEFALGGDFGGGSSHGGMFDEFRLYDVALTVDQIREVAGPLPPYQINGTASIDVNNTLRFDANLENVVIGTADSIDGMVVTRVYNVGNTTAGGTLQGVQDIEAANDPFSAGLLPAPIFWPGSAGGVYPEVFGFQQGVNREEYSVHITGEMLIEQDGTINFKDGVDDFAAFLIDTDGDGALDEIINDNTWTNEFGVNNGGSPISAAQFTNVDAGGEWRSFEFWMAEGGGGDSGALAWDFNDSNGSFPAANDAPFNASDGDDLVPGSHLRTGSMEDAVVSFDAVLQLSDVAEAFSFDVNVEQLKWDKIGMSIPSQIGNNTPDNSTLDLDGVTINVNLDADPTAGLTIDLIDNTNITQITGTPSFNFSRGDAADWDTSQFLITGQLSFGGMVIGPGLPGDYNNNGQVEQGDLDLVLLNWGTNLNAPWVTGAVDQAELDGVLLNWGNTAALGSSAGVPEPSTLALVFLAAGLALSRCRVGRKVVIAVALVACLASFSVQSTLAQIDVGGAGVIREDLIRGEKQNIVVSVAPDNGLGLLYAERYNSPTFDTWANVEAFVAANDPASEGFIDAPPIWDDGQLGTYPYPAALGFPQTNQDNYGVVITGEILIPENGFIDFRDGADDQTVFIIDEAGDGSLADDLPIIEDTAWTSLNGVDNAGGIGGQTIGFGSFTNVAAGGSWRQFVLTMDEAGGGDRISLAWSIGDDNLSFNPAIPGIAELGFNLNEGDDLIPRENYRFPGAMIEETFDSVLNYTSGANFEVNVAELEWDRLASNAHVTTADVTYIADFSGGVLSLDLTSDPVPGLTVDLIDDSANIDEIRGPASYAFSHGDMSLWDTSNFTTNGQISYAAGAAQVLVGDYNGSGSVEQGDLDLVLLNWGQSGSDLPDGWVITAPNGNIDQGELDAVLLNWGASSGLSPAGVPEPSTIAILFIAAGLGLGLIRKR